MIMEAFRNLRVPFGVPVPWETRIFILVGSLLFAFGLEELGMRLGSGWQKKPRFCLPPC